MSSIVTGLFMVAIITIGKYILSKVSEDRRGAADRLSVAAQDSSSYRQAENKRLSEECMQDSEKAKNFSKILNWAYIIPVIVVLSSSWTTVPAGSVKVAMLFGDVKDEVYTSGLNFPVNPLYSWEEYDIKQKTLTFEKIGVPSKDQLISHFDISVQYRLVGDKVPEMRKNTGTSDEVISVHLVPYFRSLVREQGKSVDNAEQFYSKIVQDRMQSELMNRMVTALSPKGIEIQKILIRNVALPPFIAKAVEEKKKREQEAEKQKAELKRFQTEQEQKIATANAEFEAAKLEEQKIRLLADAEAYKIQKMNQQLAKSEQYVNLKRVERWDGALPLYSGGDSTPLIDLRSSSK